MIQDPAWLEARLGPHHPVVRFEGIRLARLAPEGAANWPSG
jgi:hypothetical protein